MDKLEKLKTNKSDISALVKKTDKLNPKPEDLAALRKHLNEDSSLVEANNVSHHAIGRVIDNYGSNSELIRELVKRQVKEARNEMGYETANVLVRMLIDQVVMNNIRLNHLETYHLVSLSGNHSIQQGLYWDKRLTAAQKRFTRACESLARVRKLLSEADLKDEQTRRKRSQSAQPYRTTDAQLSGSSGTSDQPVTSTKVHT